MIDGCGGAPSGCRQDALKTILCIVSLTACAPIKQLLCKRIDRVDRSVRAGSESLSLGLKVGHFNMILITTTRTFYKSAVLSTELQLSGVGSTKLNIKPRWRYEDKFGGSAGEH